MNRSNAFLAVLALALVAAWPLAQSQTPPSAPVDPPATTTAPVSPVAPDSPAVPVATAAQGTPAATSAAAPPVPPTATTTPLPRKDPPGWRLAAGRDTDDPTYCRKETVPNSRFQKERCVKLSVLQQQQVLDRRNKQVGVRGRECTPGTSWCTSH